MTSTATQQTPHPSMDDIAGQPVRTFMVHKPISLVKGTRIHAAIKTLGMNNLSGAPIVDNSQRVIGVVTEHDLLMQAATKDVVSAIEYTEKVISIRPEAPLKNALLIFHKSKVRFLPVVDAGGNLVGIVNRINILNKLMGF